MHNFQCALLFGAFLVLSVGCTDVQPADVGAVTLRGESPSFFAFGDWGANSKPQRDVAEAVNNVCEKLQCDFGLLLGDNFYPAGVKSVDDPMWKSHYLEIYEKLSMPFYVALGNHDYGGNVWAQVTYKDPRGRWKMPTPYYQFQAGDAAFFATDTTRWSQAQAAWLTKALSDAGDVKWKIVFGHHPLYSYGGNHGDTPYLVKELLPILKRFNVQLYFSGHDHDRQVLREGKESPLAIVSGGGGAEIRPLKDIPRPRELFGKATYGAVHITLAAGAAKLSMFDSNGKIDYELALEDAPKKEDAGLGGEESARATKTKRKSKTRRPNEVHAH